MMKCKWVISAVGLSLVTAFAVARVNESTLAPNFTLDAASGKKISLSDLKGKYVVLEWWNNGCPVVQKHYTSGNIPKLQKEFTDQGVVWLAICSSAPGKQGHVTAADANAVMKAMGGKPTDILLDPTGVTGRAYKATATPQLVLIGPKGELLYNGAIDDNPRANGEAILKSENYLRRAWEEVKSGKPVSMPVTQAYGCSVKY